MARRLSAWSKLKLLLSILAERFHPVPPLTPEQIAELDRRLDAIEAGEARMVSWEEVKRKLSARINEGEGIRQGLADANAGRIRPAEEFFAEFEAEHGLSKDQKSK